MSDVPSEDQQFFDAGTLDYQGIEGYIESDLYSLAIFQGPDLLRLRVDEARAIRDWLNKVLP